MSNIQGDLDVIVYRIRTETSLVRSFELRSCDGTPLPAFEAGAHVDVFPADGVVRQYSLVNDPADRSHYLLGIKHEINGRGGSSAMHDLNEGSRLRISLPRNKFSLRGDASGGCSLLFAGGIGVTPILSMAQALHARGAAFELHYFANSNHDLAFHDFIAESDWYDRVFIHLGLLPPLLNEVLDNLLRMRASSDVIYLCGPAPFMDAVNASSEKMAWPRESVVIEHFSLADADIPVQDPNADAFTIRLARRGMDLLVPPEKTIIEVLREAGVEIHTNCEQGICGTCLTRVLEGEPEHHDLYLSDEEHEAGEMMTPCVSRAKSRMLVLDL